MAHLGGFQKLGLLFGSPHNQDYRYTRVHFWGLPVYGNSHLRTVPTSSQHSMTRRKSKSCAQSFRWSPAKVPGTHRAQYHPQPDTLYGSVRVVDINIDVDRDTGINVDIDTDIDIDINIDTHTDIPKLRPKSRLIQPHLVLVWGRVVYGWG